MVFSVLFQAGIATAALADVTVNFNGLSSDSQIALSIQTALSTNGYPGIQVDVTGAMLGNGYIGEDHVVGPDVGNGWIVSLALGNSDGGIMHSLNSLGSDNFIVNANENGQITMTFSQPIFGVGFDYEIFPNSH